MDIAQLLLTLWAVVGVVLVGLLAVVPSLLDRPSGRDEPEPETVPAPRRPRDGVDLAA